MDVLIVLLFSFCLAIIFFYSLVQLNLVVNYILSKKKKNELVDIQFYPKVTIQLPIYNEKNVVERLILKVLEIDYPKDLLEIQILDDSDDETSEIIKKLIQNLPDKNIQIQHIQRKDRKGYKAGALKYGTEICNGDYIAIFDADFLPDKDFLKNTIPYFTDSKVGVVQTRWAFVNESFSLLTKLQGFGLNAHFSIEQTGRNFGNHFINFNGTAGIWRKECIIDAGGWEADTLTEDLDLSYRAQLKGWKFKYLEKINSPSELPVDIYALKSQQFRWTKGAAECSMKNLKKVFRSKNTKFSTKVHATFHLLNSSVFLLIFLISILQLPFIFVKNQVEIPGFYYISGVFLSGWFLLAVFYFISFINTSKSKNPFRFIGLLFGFLAVSMGLSLHNSIAVIEGLIGKKSPFIRTPKYNIVDAKNDYSLNDYFKRNISPLFYFEVLMMLYFTFSMYCAYTLRDFGMMPLQIFLIFGYFFIILKTVKK